MHKDIEGVARDQLAKLVDGAFAPADFELDADLADGYGLTSMNKILFLMAVCDETGVGLSAFTEPDVAGMRTLRDVAGALSAAQSGTAA
jgi:hypothetical protein